MARIKIWNIYIMVDNKKKYLHQLMTTMEAHEWLNDNCVHDNGNYFMGTSQVFCECH